jgi:hypothetical protein
MSVRSTTIGRTFAISVTLIAVAAPTALANPLLSGYGGPGQGAQTIIGGGLVNPPSGGSGAAAGAPTAAELTVAGSPAPAAATTGRGAKGRPSHGHKGAGGSPRTTTASTPAVTGKPSLSSATAVASSASGGALGLSGGDVLLILVVVCCLVGTGALTRQLTRRTP